MAANQSSRNTFESAGVKQFRWVSVGDKSVCPDCQDRHGEEDTMEYFKTVGLPRSGFSICQSSCRCQVLPATYKGENLDKPLLRKEKTQPKPVTKPRPKRNNVVLKGYSSAYNQMGAYFNQLNFKILSAAKAYIKGEHTLINPILRGTFAKTTLGSRLKKNNPQFYKERVKQGRELIKNLKKFCDESPDYVGTVYRYVGVSEYGTTGLKKAQKLVDWFKQNEGGLFSNKTFWSTSNNSNLKYGGKANINLDFKIKSKTGTVLNGLNTIKNDFGIGEDEILFAPDSQFKIKKTKEVFDADGSLTLKVELEEL